jgi:hypothetical protein
MICPDAEVLHVIDLATVVAALIGAASAAIVAVIKQAVVSRAKVNETLRDSRTKVYPVIWKESGIVSRWPRRHPQIKDLQRFHELLRYWYYNTGGIYMSENTRARYGDVQELLVVQLASRRPTHAFEDKEYCDLMEAASSLRTAITEDVESRHSRSIIWAARIGLRHWRCRRSARKRIGRANRLKDAREPSEAAGGHPDGALVSTA